MAEHLEHRTIPDALAADCYYGECEHLDEQGEPSDFSACPTVSMEVCVDCMVERGYGADPQYWEDGLVGWPHGPEEEPTLEVPAPPAILKPPPEDIRCEHGYDHHGGSHSCDCCVSDNCPHWAWILEHEAAVAKLAKTERKP